MDFLKKLFIGSLSFSESLATKCMLLNNQQYKTKPFNANAFTLVIRTNELKKLSKYISYKSKCKFDCKIYTKIWNSKKC